MLKIISRCPGAGDYTDNLSWYSIITAGTWPNNISAKSWSNEQNSSSWNLGVCETFIAATIKKTLLKIVQKPKLILEKSGPNCDITLLTASSTSSLSISMNFVSISLHLSSLSQVRLPSPLTPQQTLTFFLWCSHSLELDENWSARSRHALISQSVEIIHKNKVYL